MDKTAVFLIGGGGLARDLAVAITSTHSYEVSGYWDDHTPKETLLGNLPFLGTTNDLLQYQEPISVLIAIGNPEVRKVIYQKLKANPCIIWPVIVHPMAYLADAKRISLGEGTIIFPGAILTTDIRIDENSLIRVGASLHLDTRIGAHSVIMPGARITGGAELGSGSFLCAGVCLTEKCKFPEGAFLNYHTEAC